MASLPAALATNQLAEGRERELREGRRPHEKKKGLLDPSTSFLTVQLQREQYGFLVVIKKYSSWTKRKLDLFGFHFINKFQ